MKYKIEVTAGIGEDRNGDAIDKLEGRLNGCRELAIRLFGGYTERAGKGGYTSGISGVVVEEPCVTWTCFFSGPVGEGIGDTFASTVRDILKQESVVLEVSEVNARFV